MAAALADAVRERGAARRGALPGAVVVAEGISGMTRRGLVGFALRHGMSALNVASTDNFDEMTAMHTPGDTAAVVDVEALADVLGYLEGTLARVACGDVAASTRRVMAWAANRSATGWDVRRDFLVFCNPALLRSDGDAVCAPLLQRARLADLVRRATSA